MHKFRSWGKAAVGSAVALPVAAFAAVPAAITDELGTLKDDAIAVATLVIVALVAVYAFKFIKKAL